MIVITIGRSPENDFCIKDQQVSRHHCQIVQEDNGAFYAVDLESSNGTFVNGNRIRGKVRLFPNDKVKVGNTYLPWENYFGPKKKKEGKKHKTWLIVLGVLALVAAAVLAIVLILDGKKSSTSLAKDPKSNVTNVSNNQVYNSIENEIQNIVYNPVNVTINNNERYEDCFLRYYPVLITLKEKGLGGAKLLGEICADADEKHTSRSPDGGPMSSPKPSDIGVAVDDSDDGLPKRMMDDEVSVETGPVNIDNDNSGWYSEYSTFCIYITIENKTGMDLDVSIRQGLLLETLGDNVQNLVIRKSVTVRLKAYEKQTVRVVAYCASQHRGSPTGYPVRITPFYLMAEESAYYSQESIWQWQETMYASWRNSRW